MCGIFDKPHQKLMSPVEMERYLYERVLRRDQLDKERQRKYNKLNSKEADRLYPPMELQ